MHLMTLCLFVLCLFHSSLFAQTLTVDPTKIATAADKISKAAVSSSRMTTPRALGMGQAMRGAARSNASLIYNPAGMSNISVFAVDAQYFRTADGSNTLGINIVDSETRFRNDRLALGLAYNHILNNGSLTGYEGRLGLSIPTLNLKSFQMLAGVTGRYTFDKLIAQDGFDIDTGILILTQSGLTIGAVGEGLLSENLGRFGGGIGFTQRHFTIDFDYMYSPYQELQSLHGGLEILLGNQFVIRGGYERVLKDSPAPNDILSWVSGGAAIIDMGKSRGQFNLGYRRSLESDDFIFGFSFTLFLMRNPM